MREKKREQEMINKITESSDDEEIYKPGVWKASY